MSNSIPFSRRGDRRAALPTGWGVRTTAAEARESALLADWRLQWAEESGELARRICGIERCLDGFSGAGTCPPRLTIYAPAAERLAG